MPEWLTGSPAILSLTTVGVRSVQRMSSDAQVRILSLTKDNYFLILIFVLLSRLRFEMFTVLLLVLSFILSKLITIPPPEISILYLLLNCI